MFTAEKDEERIRLEREDRKAKLELRALGGEEARSGFHKDLEKSESTNRLGDLLSREFAVQANTLKGLSGGVNSSNERENLRVVEVNLETMKCETVEALRMLM
jgi:hypothetical protein